MKEALLMWALIFIMSTFVYNCSVCAVIPKLGDLTTTASLCPLRLLAWCFNVKLKFRASGCTDLRFMIISHIQKLFYSLILARVSGLLKQWVVTHLFLLPPRLESGCWLHRRGGLITLAACICENTVLLLERVRVARQYPVKLSTVLEHLGCFCHLNIIPEASFD